MAVTAPDRMAIVAARCSGCGMDLMPRDVGIPTGAEPGVDFAISAAWPIVIRGHFLRQPLYHLTSKWPPPLECGQVLLSVEPV